MAERARQRKAEYRLRESEIIKEKPEPVPHSLKDQLRELQASRASLNTEITNKEADRSGYVTDVSSATWQFSGQSFSPRSVVSINGAKEERHLAQEGLLKVRTSVDHLRQSEAISGVARREFNEAYAHRVERYNSMPQLTQQPSAVIQIKDDKAPSRGIMKRRELETREQMMYPAEDNRSYTRTVSTVHKPVKTETVQRFEETRRTEEIERRVQRKERKDRRSRHHSSSRREEWSHGGGQNDPEEKERLLREREIREREIREREIREREIRERELREKEIRERELWEKELRERELREKVLREHELRERELREREIRERELREKEIQERESREHELRERAELERRSHSRNAYAQVDTLEVKRPKVVYRQRALTQEELNKYIQSAHQMIAVANRESRYNRSASLSRGGHAGYLPSNESYFRSTSTRRDQSQNRGDRAGWDEHIGDSLRRGELKYNPNGEVRESNYRDVSRDGRGQKVHKSYSTRDVFDQSGGYGYDRHSTASGYGTGRRGSQTGGPLVEFPPTLPRRGHQNEMDYYRQQDFRPVSKSRSFADWDDQGRAGFRGHPDWAMQRRYDDDMSRLEAEFRDSLLMPIPNGNLNEREHRTEQIPGGYETYHKDNRAQSGRRLNREGQPVDFNEASQEYSFKRETESDRRR